MPTPPWYGHLLRGITEVSHKLCDCPCETENSARRNVVLLVLSASGVPNRQNLVAQSIQRFIFLGSEEAPAKRAQSTLHWEKSTC